MTTSRPDYPGSILPPRTGSFSSVNNRHKALIISTRLKVLQDLIKKGDLAAVKKHIHDKRKMVEERNPKGYNALHIAVLTEQHEIVQYIAKNYPRTIALVDKKGRTPAHYAATQQNAIYDTLVEFGSDVRLKDETGYSAEEYRRKPDLLKPSAFIGGGGSSARLYGGSGAAGSYSGITHSSLNDSDSAQIGSPNNIADFLIDDPDAPSLSQIDDWIVEGDLENLEKLVLEGRSYLLADRKTNMPASAEFLQALPQYQSKIDAIHKAVEDGDVRRVKSLTDRTQLAVARDRKGLTPLHKAVLHGQTDTIRFLLSRYQETVNECDRLGRTALHYAAADKSGDHFIKMLQKHGADAFIEDKSGHTPFYYRTNPDAMNLRNMKDSAVMDQLLSGELSRTLLQDLEEDIVDWLHTGNVGKLEELVLNGYGDLLLGRTHDLSFNDVINFLEVLPQYQAKIAAIHRAVTNGNVREVKLLADRKKLALCRDGRGLTPLHNAIVFEQNDVVKYLIRNYPQTCNAMDHNKRTPLHFAAAVRDGGYLYKLLRKSGADPAILDCHNRAPKYYLNHPGELDLDRLKMDTKQVLKHVLHNRVAPSYLESNIQQWLREGNVHKLEQLMVSGCGDLLLERKSSHPDTEAFLHELPEHLDHINAIHKAVREGNLLEFEKLIQKKKFVMARDRKGATPLHDAVLYGQTEILRHIAQNYPHVLNAPDYNKRTALHYAGASRDGGHYYKILEKAGADPTITDNEGRSAEYFHRNPGMMDLKAIRERDIETISTHFDEEVHAHHEDIRRSRSEGRSATLVDNGAADGRSSPGSRLSDISMATPGGIFESNRASGTEEDLMISGDTEVTLEASRVAFENALSDRIQAELNAHERRSLPTTENGVYLARTVGAALTKALAEVVINRPDDPIDYIIMLLRKYHEERRSNSDSGVSGSDQQSKKRNKH